jgi:hypothetical protein
MTSDKGFKHYLAYFYGLSLEGNPLLLTKAQFNKLRAEYDDGSELKRVFDHIEAMEAVYLDNLETKLRQIKELESVNRKLIATYRKKCSTLRKRLKDANKGAERHARTLKIILNRAD